MGIEFVSLARFALTGIALLLAFLAAATWSRRRESPAATTFAVLLFSMAVYAFGYAGEVAQTTVAGAETWLDVEYLALPWAGALWVLAACQHNGIKVRGWLLFLIPALTFVAHYTNFRHLFYMAPATLVHRGPFWVLMVQRGPLSMLDNAYLLVCFLAGGWIYISAFRTASVLYRKQALVMVLSSLLPFIGYFLYLPGFTPWGLDITPVTLGLTCAVLYYGLFHCGIFDLAPLGRNLIFNSIRDGVLILDMRDRLLDFNPALNILIPGLSKADLGKELSNLVIASPPALSEGLTQALMAPEEKVEFSLGPDGNTQSFEIRSWSISSEKLGLVAGAGETSSNDQADDPAAKQVGRAILISEITAQVLLREELRRQSETDALTGIANRRRFHQALEIECLRFTRGHAPFSLLMIDLDNFKDVNDRYGHPAGDAVLRSVADTLRSSLRKTDLPARYGGEEFSVLLPETRSDGALVIAERIRGAVQQAAVEVDDEQIEVTVSIGVSSHADEREAEPNILLKKADLALYRAKAAGRDRVEIV